MNIKIILFISMLLIFPPSCGSDDSKSPAASSQGSASGDSDKPCQQTSLSLSALYDCQGKELSDSKVNSDEVAWLVLDKTKSTHKQWNGVGRYGSCTGTLLDVGGKDSDPAYIITNGHCVGFSLLSEKGVSFDMESNPNKPMRFDYFVAQVVNNSFITIENKVIKFASMDNTDVAIVELDVTYDSLVKQGINSYKLATTPPKKGQLISVVGVPQSGVKTYGLRKSDCTIGEKVYLNEGNYSFSNSYRHRCSIVGGNSGSPVFDRESKEIVAVVNTAVDDGTENLEDCALQKPCELGSDGSKTVKASENYAQPVYYLSGCFESGIFNKDLSTCQATLFESQTSTNE